MLADELPALSPPAAPPAACVSTPPLAHCFVSWGLPCMILRPVPLLLPFASTRGGPGRDGGARPPICIAGAPPEELFIAARIATCLYSSAVALDRASRARTARLI